MVGISKLYCQTIEPSDPLRYQRDSKKLPSDLLQFSIDKKPVIVWNVGQRCNLKCRHCYSSSSDKIYQNELTTAEGKKLIKDLGCFGAPVILFSGGEPLMRNDIIELMEYAKSFGIRTVLSTNGALITDKTADKFKNCGLSYVGVSLDGLQEVHDDFRQVKGAFEAAINGIRVCRAHGIKTGLRFTINKYNAGDIPAIFELAVKEDIRRICFYHLVYSGRGANITEHGLSNTETRNTIDGIINLTYKTFNSGFKLEVLTVDNHADGVYLYLRTLKEDEKKADNILKLLKMNGGNSSGVGIGCVSFDGTVYADQFLRNHPLGNVKEKTFADIWQDKENDFLNKLKNKEKYIKGRCSLCKYFDICRGNFRARASAMTGDIWESDPACYLTDEEIGIKK